MIEYRTLKDTPLDRIHQAFVDAFSDYQVKMDLPFWRFEQMLIRRGFCPDASMGAFDGAELVGFVLNGLREWKGKPTAYDLGTGVVPSYRRQGITSSILKKIKALLFDMHIAQYLLEVLTVNESAFSLYQKQGFAVQREFACFRCSKEQLAAGSVGCVVRIDDLDLDPLKSFWDFDPSWQNAMASVHALRDAFACVAAKAGDEIIGYGLIDKKSGDIPQLAVSRAHRRSGIGRSILWGLAKATESGTIGVLNIEAGEKHIIDFLLASGFTAHVSQYEMLLPLVPSQEKGE